MLAENHSSSALREIGPEATLRSSQGEPPFDRITRLTASLLRAPIALITLVDSSFGNWSSKVPELKSGPAPEESFCAHTISDQEITIVPDTLSDPRFSRHPLVRGDASLRFYAGAPLTLKDGQVIGALAVFDQWSRPILDEDSQIILRDLAALVVDELELRGAYQADGEEQNPTPHPMSQILHQLVDSAPLAVLSIGENGVETRWNDAAAEAFAWTIEDLTIGQSDAAERAGSSTSARQDPVSEELANGALHDDLDDTGKWPPLVCVAVIAAAGSLAWGISLSLGYALWNAVI